MGQTMTATLHLTYSRRFTGQQTARKRAKTSRDHPDPAADADTMDMKKIRNLPLAVRLAGAFGALTLALVIVAFTGMRAMNGISGKADALATTNWKPAEVLADMQMRAKDDVSLGEQHLYVHDGELAVEDGVARDIAADGAAMTKDAAQLGPLFAGTGAADEYA